MARKKSALPNEIIESYINNCYTLIRKCPKCSTDILYTGKSCRWNVKLAIKHSTVCKDCHTGKFSINNIPWNKGIPMTIQAKQKNSNLKKNKPIHTIEYKNWLRENSRFCIRGENSITTQQMLKRLNLTYIQFLEYSKNFKLYRKAVWHITKQQPLDKLENYNKRGLAGRIDAYHLDHIISIKEGYIRNIPPVDIGSIDNLRMIPWLENIKKGTKSILKENK